MPLVNVADESPEARIGQWVQGRWRIERLIGAGGMATVYEACHRNQSRVALKILHPHLGLSPEQFRRFQREGYAANRVNHPGVVRVHDDDVTEDGCPFLVMELLSGVDYGERATASGGRLPPEEVLELGIAVLDVLAAAHAEGILHRDVKPENLFMTRDGVLKVLDFGIARVRDPVLESNRTEAGTLLGTPAFVAPEQARGRVDQIDERTDVWAVGATLFTLLAGRFVHLAATPNEQLALAMTMPPPRLRSVVSTVPEALAQVVDRALAFEQNDRWPSALAMQAALESVKQNWGDVVASPDVVPAAVDALYADSGVVSTRTLDSGGGTAGRAAVAGPEVEEGHIPGVPVVRRRWLVPPVLFAIALGLGALVRHGAAAGPAPELQHPSAALARGETPSPSPGPPSEVEPVPPLSGRPPLGAAPAESASRPLTPARHPRRPPPLVEASNPPSVTPVVGEVLPVPSVPSVPAPAAPRRNPLDRRH